MKPNRCLILLVALTLILTACSGTTQPTPASSSNTPTQEQTQPVAPTTTGSGSFNLEDSAAGLESLASYTVTLSLNFDGTSNGTPYKTSQSFNLGVNREAGLRTLRETFIGPDGVSDGYYTASLGNLVYMQYEGDETCAVDIAADPTAPVFEPAAILPAVRGAVEAGNETVNGIPAKLYTFDAPALNAGKAEASGKVWIADPGGWVVKYELSLTSGADVFGEGYEGTQTWAYSLTDAGSAVVTLEPVCPASLSGLPIPEDAVNVEALPGMISFTSAQSAEEVSAYYASQLTAGGWIARGAYPDASTGAISIFSRAAGEKEQILMVSITAADSGQLVKLMQIEGQAPAPAQ